jgi:outer membrane protein assembly factor BamA
VDVRLDLMKQDSTYLNVTQTYGFNYYKNPRAYIKMYVKLFTSHLLSIDTASIISSHALPSQLDIQNTSYGFQLNNTTTDFKLNPTTGWEISVDVAVTLRQILPNSKIVNLHDPNDTGFRFSALYASRTLKSTYYTLSGYVRRYLHAGKLSVFKLAVAGSALSNEHVGLSEMYRAGGLTNIRGFAEQSFYTPAYAYSTIEYRLRLADLSYAFLFYDQGLVNAASQGSTRVIYPYGLGAGLTFNTKAGLFALSYAMGTLPPDAVNVKNAKVQFGYTGYF